MIMSFGKHKHILKSEKEKTYLLYEQATAVYWMTPRDNVKVFYLRR